MDMLTEIKAAEQAAEEKKAEAKGQAKVLLEEAQTAAQKQVQKEVAEAKTDAANILQQAREQAAKETAAAKAQTEKEKEQLDIKETMNNDSDEEGELLAPERKTKKVEEFDTSQPFTDDSDEVEFDVADYEDEREVALGESRFHDDSELKDGKEDESKKEDFIENIDDVIINDSVDNNKEDIDKTVKKQLLKK